MAPPRKKRKSSTIVVPEEDEDDVRQDMEEYGDSGEEGDASDVQQAAHKQFSVSDENLDRMVNTAILYSLSMEHTRKSIKKVDFKKVAVKPYHSNVSTALYREVFRRAQARLRATFGMELHPLPAREIPKELIMHAPSKTKKKEPVKRKELVDGQLPEEEDDSNNDAFILRNVLPLQYRLTIGGTNSKLERTYDAITQILVMLVALRDGVLPKIQLENIFKQLGFDMVDTFEAVISRMRKDRYLDQAQEQINSEQSVSKVYLLPRAKVEFTAGSMDACYKRLLRDTRGPNDTNDDGQQQQQSLMVREQFNRIFGEELDGEEPQLGASEAHASD